MKLILSETVEIFECEWNNDEYWDEDILRLQVVKKTLLISEESNSQ